MDSMRKYLQVFSKVIAILQPQVKTTRFPFTPNISSYLNHIYAQFAVKTRNTRCHKYTLT